MIREICRDPFFLARKSEPATADDLGVVQDLLDTLAAHREGCVGMAANMIGVGKRIIAFESDGAYTKKPQGARTYAWHKETIECSFSEAKENHGLRFARMLGIQNMRKQCFLKFVK